MQSVSCLPDVFHRAAFSAGRLCTRSRCSQNVGRGPPALLFPANHDDLVDASRFLAQSQSRFSNFVQPDGNDRAPRNPNDRFRRANQGLRSSRQFAARPSQGNPYLSASNFNFASRYGPAPEAPLFHSALDEFREEDDEEERERETADFFALQRSRRVFASTRLDDSQETDGDASNASLDDSKDEDRRAVEDRGSLAASRAVGMEGSKARGAEVVPQKRLARKILKDLKKTSNGSAAILAAEEKIEWWM